MLNYVPFYPQLTYLILVNIFFSFILLLVICLNRVTTQHKIVFLDVCIKSRNRGVVNNRCPKIRLGWI